MNLYSILMSPPRECRDQAVALSSHGRADQCRFIVAANSKAAAYRAFVASGSADGLSRYAFDLYGSGWNKESPSGLTVLADPGVVYWQPLDPADRDLVIPIPAGTT